MRPTFFLTSSLLILSWLSECVWAQDAGPSDEIIVTGLYDKTIAAQSIAASISVLDITRLKTIAAIHPSEALNSVSGINIHRGSGQEHLTAIRSPVLTGGAGAGSFLYLEDGVPLRAAGFANVNGLFEGGTEFAQGFEVFKGPGPATYGSNAVHGLINIRSQNIDGPNSLRLLASDDGFVGVTHSVRSGPIRASLSLAHDNGFREDSGFDQQKFQLKYTGKLGQWDIESLSSFSNLNQETAGFLQGDDIYKDKILSRTNANPEAFRDGKSYRVQTKLSRAIGKNTIALTPYARRAELRFLRHFVPGQALEKNGHSSVGLQSAYFGDDFNIGADLEYTKGFLYEFQDNPSRFSFTQGLHYDYQVDAIVAAAYAQKDIRLGDNITLNIGARAEYTDYTYDNRADTGRSGRFIRSADRSDGFFTVTPKATVKYSAGEALYYIRAARGSRAPQVTDLYSVQLNQVVGQAEVETLDSLEFGYKLNRDNLRFELVGFAMQKDNFFFRNANGFNVTNGKTDHIGVEASFTAPISDWLAFGFDGTLARHRYAFSLDEGNSANSIVDGTRVDSAPDTLATARLIITPKPAWGTEIEWRHVGSYFTNPGNTAQYNGHNIFVLRSRYALTEGLSVFSRIDNVFDTRYADRADFAFGNERYFPGRPRTLFFGLTASY